jgi:hypothetical protein
MRICTVITCVWVGLAALSPTPAFAQSAGPAAVDERAGERLQGWTVRPALDYALVWDSNVLVQNQGATGGIRDNIVRETVHMFRPRGVVDFVGRRGEFGANYEGAFTRHANLSSLNSFDQRLRIAGRRQITRRTVFFAVQEAAVSPTTELLELVAVPFGRLGTRLLQARTGVERALGKRTEANVSYRFQHVSFERNPEVPTVLYGGSGHGVALSLKHAIRERTALTADYDIEQATVVNGDAFGLQAGSAGAEHSLSDVLKVFGSAGVSRLGTGPNYAARLGPAVRLGLVRQSPTLGVSLRYSRSFVPSYGFGGTTHNEELATTVRAPIARRLHTYATLAWRRNEPLNVTHLPLQTLWFHGSLAYTVFEGIQLEAFSTGTHQTMDAPAGRVDRYQFGLQVTAGRTARIR